MIKLKLLPKKKKTISQNNVHGLSSEQLAAIFVFLSNLTASFV